MLAAPNRRQQQLRYGPRLRCPSATTKPVHFAGISNMSNGLLITCKPSRWTHQRQSARIRRAEGRLTTSTLGACPRSRDYEVAGEYRASAGASARMRRPDFHFYQHRSIVILLTMRFLTRRYAVSALSVLFYDLSEYRGPFARSRACTGGSSIRKGFAALHRAARESCAGFSPRSAIVLRLSRAFFSRCSAKPS